MEYGGLMSHSHGLSNNPYPEHNQTKFLVLIPISLRSILIMFSQGKTFKYLGVLLTNQNYIHGDIKCIFKAENQVIIQSLHLFSRTLEKFENQKI